MKHFILAALLCFAVTSTVFAQIHTVNLIGTNSSFEQPLAGGQAPDWDPVWSRDPNGASGAIDTSTFHSGMQSFRVTSVGADDWALSNHIQLTVPENSLVTIGAWVKSSGAADAEIGVVERGANSQAINWIAGRTDCSGTHDWIYVHRTFGPPSGTATVQFRLTGSGPGTIWIDDASLSITPFSAAIAPETRKIDLVSSTLHAEIDPSTGGTLTVNLKNSKHAWHQLPDSGLVVVDDRKIDTSTAKLTLINRDDGTTYTATVHLEDSVSAIDIKVAGDPGTPIDPGVEYPPAFETAPGEALVIPTNEGLLYPVDDPAVAENGYQLYQGHGGLCMAWFGQESLADGSGVMAIVPTPDDATLNMHRPVGAPAGSLTNQILWEPTKGTWGYDRRIQYIFFAEGGYVAQAKAYRRYAQQIGLVKTLAEKRAANPNIDKLIGAADIWDWDTANVARQAQEFKDAGMDRVLWANAEPSDTIDKLNQLGYLSSRYDIYQDEYDPSAPEWDPKSDQWPNDLQIDRNGNRVVSWIDYQTGPDGKKVAYTANACCSIPGLVRAEQVIPAELSTKHYTCRFIDTITASPWRECYSPVHPTTRTIDKVTKMKLLNFVSNTEHLITGSETGIDCAVPYEDYFEGMMSLAHYRLPDSGYKIGVYQIPTPDFLKFQIGVGYRIPLFELVFHDCMVDTWYWGDASNQEPEVWNQRDLWNILYGTSPIYIIDSTKWAAEKDRLIQSYQNVSTADRTVGYAQMVSHRFLTADHSVQQTRWSNGTVITVNFGSEPYRISQVIAPLGYDISK